MLDPGGEAGLGTAAADGLVDGGVGVGVRDEGLGAQVGDGDDGLAGQAVVGGDREHERLDLERAQREVVATGGRAQHAEVEAAVAQSLGLGRGEQVGVDLEGHLGEVAGQGAGDAGQLGERRSAGERDPEQPQVTVGDPAHPAGAVLQGVQRAPGLGLEELTGRGQADLPGGADEQRGAELALELTDRLRQRRLRHVQALRGAAEVTGLGDRGEVAQVSQLHVASVWSVGFGRSRVAPSGRAVWSPSRPMPHRTEQD